MNILIKLSRTHPNIYNQITPIIPYLHKNLYAMSMLTDRITQRQNKKSQEQFKKQIQLMANKPSFTLMDYKQRVTDQLNGLKSSFRKKMAKQSKQAEKLLNMEKKILSAIFQEQLISQEKLTFSAKKEIALVAEVPIQKVHQTIKKAQSYKKMHRFLRDKHVRGQELPQSMNGLQYEFRNSKFQFSAKERMYMRWKQERKNPGFLRHQRNRYIKFGKNA